MIWILIKVNKSGSRTGAGISKVEIRIYFLPETTQEVFRLALAAQLEGQILRMSKWET